jgi:hypothetical protein
MISIIEKLKTTSTFVTTVAGFVLIVVRNMLNLCGLVVRVPGYRSRGPEFDSQRYQIF